MTQDEWLKAHPYLEPIARFLARIAAAGDALDVPSPPVPCWDDYTAEFLEGVPLLRSAFAPIDLEPAGRLAEALVERLASGAVEGRLAEDITVLACDLRREPDAARRLAGWLLGGDDLTPASPGLLRCLSWIGVAAWLRPVVDEYAAWRDDDRWLRRYCPACGSLPAMAQLAGVDPGRLRLLSCGCCGSRWRYGRTGCPFCETASHRLAVIAVAGEGGLRIDYCEACRAYLKTYDGQGSEALFLADWTSLHLDLVAQDRGLKRMAASLYELEPAVENAG